ncbi:MAG TPA: 50S ribosomal protein L25 [Candidatus Paceibacterota bacterium]
MITLSVEKRDMKSNVGTLRKKGIIPAVFYGPKEKNTPVSVSMSDFIKVWRKAGESSVILLKESENEHEALIHDIDVHPVTGVPRHVDFYVIEKGKKVKVKVPIEFEGTSPAVKDKGGILVKVLRELEIEASPKDLPHEIKIDISPLTELDSVIIVKDIKLPESVTLISLPGEIVASIAVAKEEVEEVKPIDMSSIEVEKKGKEAKEGEEGAPVAEEGKEAKVEKK